MLVGLALLGEESSLASARLTLRPPESGVRISAGGLHPRPECVRPVMPFIEASPGARGMERGGVKSSCVAEPCASICAATPRGARWARSCRSGRGRRTRAARRLELERDVFDRTPRWHRADKSGRCLPSMASEAPRCGVEVGGELSVCASRGIADHAQASDPRHPSARVFSRCDRALASSGIAGCVRRAAATRI